MRASAVILRNELRILRHDPVPAVILLAMPLVLVAVLTEALAPVLHSLGYTDATGAEQTVPGMAVVFSFFAVGFIGFAFFREHGWGTWRRLRTSALSPGAVIAGKVVLPLGLMGLQHVALFCIGLLFLDLHIAGSPAGVVLVAMAYCAAIAALGLAATAVFSTVQQLNAVTNLGAMVVGGLGGSFVPLRALPPWAEAIAPVSPAYWAMRGYRSVLLHDGGVSTVFVPVAVLLAVAAAALALAAWQFRLDDPKTTWG